MYAGNKVEGRTDGERHDPIWHLGGEASVTVEKPVAEYIMGGPLPHRGHA